jgi:hypothetical protein
MALRDNQIEDKLYGCGRLLRDYYSGLQMN